VIGFFAGISEVAMTVVLVRLPPEPQWFFLWFVMLFPAAIVAGFFFVSYRKPAVWFSPGDYETGQLYLDSIQTNQANSKSTVRIEQLEESVRVIQAALEQLAEKTPGGASIRQEVAQQRERLLTRSRLKQNDFYQFLTDDLQLTDEEVRRLLSVSETIHDLPTQILDFPDGRSKSQRLDRVVSNFPQAASDFESLVRIVSDGDQ
jgi:hypothetical protein